MTLGRSSHLILRSILICTFLFLYTPMVTLIAFSFNDSKRNIIWQGFTLKYYEKALSNNGLIEAFINSITIALASTLVSVILGVMTAFVLWRSKFRLKPIFETAVTLPIVIPEICLAVAVMVFFNQFFAHASFSWPYSLIKIIIAHISFSFPFVAVVVRARLASFNPEEEEAARDLGASQWMILCHVIIPHLKPSFLAGGLLAFTLSLDDFVVTFFTSGPDTLTFPVKVYSMIRFSVTPEVNAASTMLIAITVVASSLAIWVQIRR